MKFFFQSSFLLASLSLLLGTVVGQNILLKPAATGVTGLLSATGDTALSITADRTIRIKTNPTSVTGTHVFFKTLQVNMTDDDLAVICGSTETRLAVKGNAHITGNIAVGGIMTCSSDRRFKKNIQVLPNTLAKVMQLQGVSYEWRTDEFPSRSFGAGTQIGLIAQDVEALFPDLVTTDGSGYKSVNYIGLVPVLIEAIKAQQAQIEGLQQQAKVAETATARLDALEARLNALTAEQPAEAPAAGRR